ncbi:MAG: class II aldolase/adducin family protein [Gammaproteobacteria bacterium]|nr:class II aldolase/adducin family protein [Gammaproteobacteria bacterium]
MNIDEGYIKYQSFWTRAPIPNASAAEELDGWRRPLFDAGLIGQYEEYDVGFGNISLRSGGPGEFLISGTQTGHLAKTDKRHYSLVTSWSVHGNRVCCVGQVQASSEAMTHAAIYQLDLNVGAIVHVHSGELWRGHLNRLPTTNPDVAYGTPQMANEFRRLYSDTDFRKTKLAIMAGHEEGLISIGTDLEEAATRVLDLWRELAGD